MDPFLSKVARFTTRKVDSFVGRLTGRLESNLAALELRPFELHLELTNLCNAECIFCPYQFQQRPHQFMSDEVFTAAVDSFCRLHGGSVGLTPIVGDALIDPKFLDRVRALRARPEIDRIFLTTNGILIDRFGVENLLSSGIDSVNISTSGFEEASYRRIYRSSAYTRMRNNVTALTEENARRGKPVNITIAIRTDRRLGDVLKDPDFQPILRHDPQIDFTWHFATAGGRITPDMLSPGMVIKSDVRKHEGCVNLYNGPIVLPDGTVVACSCLAAMDALADLAIGNVVDSDLLDLWRSKQMRDLRDSFPDRLNPTCAKCDMYRNLDLYRTSGGSRRASLNRERLTRIARRADRPRGPFAGG